MKKALSYIVVTLVWYSAFAIGCAEFNPFEWHEDARTGFGVFWIFWLIATWCAHQVPK